MKHVNKSPEVFSAFEDWKRDNVGATWKEFSGNDIYNLLKQHLVNEQLRLCCYCEIALENISAHIEHFKPRSLFQNETFNIQNIFACCSSSNNCGHKKQGEYFRELISPLDEDCQSYFTYTANGQIIPKNENDSVVQRTIDLLGLNSKPLKSQRESIIKALECDGLDSEYFNQALRNCVSWHNGFYTVIEYVAMKQGLRAQ